jgi:hypothetical protein
MIVDINSSIPRARDSPGHTFYCRAAAPLPASRALCFGRATIRSTFARRCSEEIDLAKGDAMLEAREVPFGGTVPKLLEKDFELLVAVGRWVT